VTIFFIVCCTQQHSFLHGHKVNTKIVAEEGKITIVYNDILLISDVMKLVNANANFDSKFVECECD